MAKTKIKNTEEVVEESQEKVDEAANLKVQLARALADYDNLRKRTESEKSVWMKFAKQDLLVKLLPVLDTLEVAQKHLNDQGLLMAITQFKNVFKEEGIEEITDNENFNEELHEAIDVVEGGVKGTIAEVLQKGYKFVDGSIIRPVKVRVYKGVESEK